jgi:4-amino-4-deoxy-L-arabinose transferase-like glycosyltransferase
VSSLLYVFAFAVGLAVALICTGGAGAVLVCVALALGLSALIQRADVERQFLMRLFLAGLIARVVLAALLFQIGKTGFFGPDSATYDSFGFAIANYWMNAPFYSSFPVINPNNLGMSYIVAIIYFCVGRNPLAVQFFNSVVGAATAPVIFLCTYHIFRNLRAARVAAILTAFFPSLILWSSLGLKDATVVFALSLTMLATLKLTDKIDVKFIALLLISLIGLLTLRFYIFYMMLIVVGGSFVIGSGTRNMSGLIRNFVLLIMVGLSLTYLGVLRNAPKDFETYGNLEKVQEVRKDATRANSSFGKEVDVSTTSGALTAIPLGLLYVLFAPFPWQFGSLQQAFTFPEMLVWWASFPLLIVGMKYSLQHKLRETAPVFMFTILTTLVYSLFQGNVGTAYRQRAQLLIFYFIFVAVGFVVVKERRENRGTQPRKARANSVLGLDQPSLTS